MTTFDRTRRSALDSLKSSVAPAVQAEAEGIKVDIKVTLRGYPNGGRGSSRDLREYRSATRVYFSHRGESVVEHFGNRRDRPIKMYREHLAQVAEKLGLPQGTKFRWSRYAGCTMCPCSPGFICDDDRTDWDKKRDVWVMLSGTAPKTAGKNPEKVAACQAALLIAMTPKSKSIKGFEIYEPRRYASRIVARLERPGSTLALYDGDVFYVRAAASKAGTYRVVTEGTGVNKVFSIGISEYTWLMRRSRSL